MRHRNTRLYHRVVCWVLVATFAGTIGGSAVGGAKRVLILGVDGLDPTLLQQFMDANILPNFRKLVAQGDFKPLTTTMPPLSPVAWSTFITGLEPDGHRIFDFVHRDPATLLPQAAMAKTIPPKWQVTLGSWVLPLSKGKVESQRQGQAFWQILEAHGIPTQIFRMPANFPPAPSPGKALSGMGTPDILGTPGTFSFYTTDPPADANDISGGRVYAVRVRDHHVRAQLVGPDNPFRRLHTSAADGADNVQHPPLTIDFDVFLDPVQPVVKFVVEEEEFILQAGEWSDWIQLDFTAVPYLAGISAMARFYLQDVRPTFRLYVTPLQINPADPIMPLSTPRSWSKQLSQDLGSFYTQELPEDTKALSGGIFSPQEFW